MKYWYLISAIACIFIGLCIMQKRKNPKTPYEAVTIIPVADLIESSTQSLFPHAQPEDIYDFLPLCGGYTPAPSFSCPRVHQLLFNEIVEVVQEKGDEILVNVSNAYHLYKNENSSKTIPDVNLRAHKNNTPLNSFWTLKRNVLPLQSIEANNLDLKKIPPPISFKNKPIPDTKVVTLAMPFTCPESYTSYSAGTRFVKTTDQPDENSIRAHALSLNGDSFTIINIPSHLCIGYAKTQKEKIQQFVALIKQWANLDSGYIPYVWGGSSFIHTSNKESQEIKLFVNNTETSYFSIDDFNYKPKPGFDCSGIINRAAQICGIPFHLRLSSTMATLLEELQPGEKLEEGDIIWKPFHVFIVSSLENNLILEARGHGNGEGKTHEAPLHKIFKDLYTYQDLEHAFHNKITIYRLTKDGEILHKIPEFKILKLSSAWKVS